ncbi:hypothetical protein BGZ57DRAFT_862967 [Hyaloscypha finlandica]|nr:hypothetical protein BGZ57DRAFT_862967 [Hyaloscypha finlandica]
MRLLHTSEIRLEEAKHEINVKYAILSHTWNATELSLQDLNKKDSRYMIEYKKVRESCEKAKPRNDWIWIDSCCIDKSSSAELSESINSMYRWYEDADICYVYLEDFEGEEATLDSLSRCKWFSRGWTLQELLAPSNVSFCNKSWTEIGTKRTLATILSTITGIPLRVLQGSSPLHCTVAQRFSWASSRQTTRGEDIAYSLLGLFDVHMPPIYGEGSTKAFRRLQSEILVRWNDQTIFMWTPSHELRNYGLLATSPRSFCRHRECFKWLQDVVDISKVGFIPYDIIKPAPSHEPHIAAALPGSLVEYKRVMILSNNEDHSPILGHPGLQVSLLLSGNTRLNFFFDEMKFLTACDPAVCLDVVVHAWWAAGSGWHVILPLRFDTAFGFDSEDINRRGCLSRVPPIYGEMAAYRLTCTYPSFRRQTFWVSQQDPIPPSTITTTFTFDPLPPTISFVAKITVPAPTTDPQSAPAAGTEIPTSLHCLGGIITFTHTLFMPYPCCKSAAFLLSFGTHGVRATPWCYLSTSSRVPLPQAEIECPTTEMYERIAAYSSCYKTQYTRRLDHGCRHVVGVEIAPRGGAAGFGVKLRVFDHVSGEDVVVGP